ncbi:BPSL0761 family protein [Paraburkholderia humisilvae]|uniref:Uncharacterized protein n=2 Tax=Paraburkholderia humisilvae TaxID=627669 RepID=A0A6J5DQD9_9BURK|nr:hypothetical protein LMG29542_02600 [Paraburkholderia humisilvae]
MTIPYERSMAVLRARNLLTELAYADNRRDEETLRRYARSLLKHYPDAQHMKLSVSRLPEIWGDSDEGYLGTRHL